MLLQIPMELNRDNQKDGADGAALKRINSVMVNPKPAPVCLTESQEAGRFKCILAVRMV